MPWLIQQSELLRARQFERLDIDSLIEELECAVRHERRALASRLRVLIVHLLKCQYQPGKRTHGWQNTIVEQRIEIEELLQANPSLRRFVAQFAPNVCRAAVRKASQETRLAIPIFPEQLPYCLSQLLDYDFYPKA